MQIPVRLAVLLRPRVAPGVLLAVGFTHLVLTATPFLLDLVAEVYDVGLATAALITTTQLGGFAAGSWGAGRWLRPSRRVFLVALLLAVSVNAISAFLPPFAVLLGLRLVSGLSIGLITWFAWVQVFGDNKGMSNVAVIGPVVGIAASPVIAGFALAGGASAVFGFLAALAVVPLAVIGGTGAADAVPPRSQRSSPVPAAVVLLIALGLFTLGGSSIFQYAVVIGTGDVGLSTGTVAALFSLNAVVSIPASVWPWSRGIPSPWMVLTAVCALLVTVGGGPVAFAIGVGLWGFGFWMAVPAAFAALAARSAHPSDRAGDAQAIMSVGRVFGPLLGGLVIDALGVEWLGVLGAGTMLVAAGTVFAVRAAVAPRRRQLPGTVPGDDSPAES
ncbi:MAG: hypothetical protein AAF467_08985 [Actinomycetota bacterium]